MNPSELEAQILRLFHAEKWRVGTIARQLGIHHSTVRRLLEHRGVAHEASALESKIDPYLPFILETLESYPRLPRGASTRCAPGS